MTAAVTAAAGCSAPFAPPGLIDTFRVLGVQSDPAAVAPDERATLTVFTADAVRRDVAVVWYRCDRSAATPDAGIGGGGVTDCRNAIEFGRGTSVTAVFAGATRVALYACAGGAIAPPPTGARWPVCEGGVGWLATRNVPGRRAGSDPDSVARNPGIAEVRLGLPGEAETALAPDAPAVVRRCEPQPGAGASAPPCPRARITVALDAPTRAWLTAHNATVVTARFALDRGTLTVDSATSSDPDAVFATEWTPPREATPAVTLWITVAESRGGFAFAQRAIRVAAE